MKIKRRGNIVKKQISKMLYLVFLVVISVASVTPRAADLEYVTVEPDRAVYIFNIFKNCADKIGADAKIMVKVIDFSFEDNETENKLLHCFLNTSGYGDDNGHLTKEKFVKLTHNHKNKEKFINVVDECNKLGGNDKYDTAYKIVNCFRNTSPILFKI